MVILLRWLFLFLWVGASSTVIKLAFGCLLLPLRLERLVLTDGQHSPLLLVLVLFVLTHVERLVVLAGEFFLGPKFVADGLVDPGAAACAFDIGGVETAHVGLVEGDAVLEGILFGAR